MRNKKERPQAIVSFTTIVCMFVLSILVAQGFSVSFDRIVTAEFWIQVGSNLAVTMICYFIYYEIDNDNRRMDADGRYYKTLKRYLENKEKFYSADYYDALDKAIEWKNNAYREDANNEYLHTHGSGRLTMRDFENIKSIDDTDEICKSRFLSERQIRKVKKALQYIFDGRVGCQHIRPDDVISDRKGNGKDQDGFAYNDRRFRAQRTGAKMTSFLLVSVILSTIEWQLVDNGLFETIVSKLSLLGGAVCSAIMDSKRYIRCRIANLEERNTLLEQKVFKAPHEALDVVVPTSEGVFGKVFDSIAERVDDVKGEVYQTVDQTVDQVRKIGLQKG